MLIPWATGLVICSYAVSRWQAVGRGFHRLIDAVSALIVGLALYSAVGGQSGTWSWLVLGSAGALALLTLCASAASFIGPDHPRRWCEYLEGLASAAGIAACIGVGMALDHRGLGIARALAAAVFLGSATATMVMGHWFLVDPHLPREAISRLAKLFVAATLVEIAALLIPPGMIGAFRTERLGIGGYLPTFWVALAATSLLLGLLVIAALRERGYPAVMAATGLSYLTILSAFGVDVIGKALISA